MKIIGKINKGQHKNYYGFLFLTSLVVLTSISYMSMSSNSLIGKALALRPVNPPNHGDGPDYPTKPTKPVDPCAGAADDPACGQCGIAGCQICPAYTCHKASNQVSANLQEISNFLI